MAQTEAEPPTSSDMKASPDTRRRSTAAGGRPLLSWPVATVAILAGVLVLLVGGGLLLRQITGPATPVSSAPSTAATPATTVSAPPVAAPQTIAPATLPPVVAAPATAMPTPLPTAAPTTVLAAPTSAGQPVAAAVGQSPGPSPFPTVPPEHRRDVETAYTQYWDARALAVWTLDPAPFDNVATGEELSALRHDVEQLRADGRGIKVEVQHQYTEVSLDGDLAKVLDRLRDYSIYVDPTSKQPLLGEERPDDASAPLLTSLYFLGNTDDTWKVERGEAYANN